jgi:hypothetical protein
MRLWRSNRYKDCVHKAAAFLQYTSNLEARLFAGGNYIAQLEDNTGDKTLLDEANDLFTDLLDRYERCCDLLKAIEAGWNIELTGPFKLLKPFSRQRGRSTITISLTGCNNPYQKGYNNP